MTKKIILVVDDNKNFRETVRAFVENNFKDIEINEAETGEEAIKMAVKNKPDVSLIDVRLPGIDGIQTAQQIRDKVFDCAIILMSMFNQSAIGPLVDQRFVTFIHKSEIDSKLVPLLHKFLVVNNA